MSYSYKDKLQYELSRIMDDAEAQEKFFEKAVYIQSSPKTYDDKYADDKKELACDVLSRCGWCTDRPCNDCKLHIANIGAHNDISNGLRKRPDKQDCPSRYCDEYVVRLRVDKNTGVVTAVMRCFGD